MKLPFIVLSLGIFCCTVRAQNASLAPDDLEFSRGIIARFHSVAWVDIERQKGQVTSYQYDLYPHTQTRAQVERIKCDEGVFARPEYKTWVRSDDWGETGKPVSAELAAKLDYFVEVTKVPFRSGSNKDATQGGEAWNFLREDPKDEYFRYFTYERTREHPRAGGNYPQYTFMKAADDKDGQLFVRRLAANLREGDLRIPLTIRMTYLIPVAAGSKVKVFDKDTGTEKVNTTVGKNSGWEITTQQSAPPADD